MAFTFKVSLDREIANDSSRNFDRSPAATYGSDYRYDAVQ